MSTAMSRLLMRGFRILCYGFREGERRESRLYLLGRALECDWGRVAEADALGDSTFDLPGESAAIVAEIEKIGTIARLRVVDEIIEKIAVRPAGDQAPERRLAGHGLGCRSTARARHLGIERRRHDQ